MVLNGFSCVFHKKGKATMNRVKQRSKVEELKGVQKKVSVLLR